MGVDNRSFNCELYRGSGSSSSTGNGHTESTGLGTLEVVRVGESEHATAGDFAVHGFLTGG